LVEQKRVELEHIPSGDNEADIFTKPLAAKKFWKALKGLQPRCGHLAVFDYNSTTPVCGSGVEGKQKRVPLNKKKDR
jgi:hypothetical protein